MRCSAQHYTKNKTWFAHCATQVRPYLFYTVFLEQCPGDITEYCRAEFVSKNKPEPPRLRFVQGEPNILHRLKQPIMLDECFKLLAQNYPAGDRLGALPSTLVAFRDANFVRAPLLPPQPKASIEVS